MIYRIGQCKTVLAVAVAFLAAGCATTPRTMYAWGAYEDVVYTAQAKPGILSPEAQAEQLEKDRLAATTERKRLPPGWHAHLAYLYSQTGRVDLARSELLAERVAYPESAVLADRLIANLNGGKKP
jgi:hypothetical protein